MIFEEQFQKAYEIEKNIKQVVTPNLTFNVLDYGLINDGVFDNYHSLKQLIEKSVSLGGAVLKFPEGKYFIGGPIVLKTNIHLCLEDATLIFTSDASKYLINDKRSDGCVKVVFEGTTIYNYCPNIYAYQAQNIAVVGRGAITGSSKQYEWRAIQKNDQKKSRKMNNDDTNIADRVFGAGHYLRYDLIGIYESSQILIEGIKIYDCSFWLVHLVLSNNIIIRKLQFDAFNLNNDGIDPESCSDVLIEDCHFGNGDDNIAIKSFRDLEGIQRNVPTKNVYVKNCLFHGVNAMCIGSEISGGAHDIFVENCQFKGNVGSALHIKVNKDRGGIVENIYMRNLAFGQVNDGVSIIMNYKNENTYNRIPVIKNVYIGNVTFDYVVNDVIKLIGIKESPITNIDLVNIKANKIQINQIFTENIKIDLNKN